MIYKILYHMDLGRNLTPLAGIWHITSRCVRRERLLETPGSREWLSEAFAHWLDVLAAYKGV